MKKWILLLTLCISLLLSGCQKTPEAQPGTQPAEAPWADEQADAPLSYEDYFAELRPYDPAENDVPDWMKDGNYEILSEDGVLSLYQAANETLTRLFAYPVEVPLGWSAGPACLYAFDEQTIYRLDYGGEAAEPIYRATDGAILQMAAAGDALFFAEQGELSIRLCRLYAPEGKLDVFYDEVRPDAEDLLLFPVSNHELCWTMDDPDFLELAAEQEQTYIETRNIDPADKSTYWGMLELDFGVNSGIRYYYNDLEPLLCSQGFRKIYGEESCRRLVENRRQLPARRGAAREVCIRGTGTRSAGAGPQGRELFARRGNGACAGTGPDVQHAGRSFPGAAVSVVSGVDE